MTIDPSLSAKAREIAKQQALNDALVCAVIDHESGWNTWLNRYEPIFENSYGKAVTIAAQTFLKSKPAFTVTLSTEIKNRCMSWGLMQLMGETAREYGYLEPMAKLCDPETGITWGCKKLAACLKRTNGDRYKALGEYNGGADPNYAPDVIQRMGQFVLSTMHANDL